MLQWLRRPRPGSAPHVEVSRYHATSDGEGTVAKAMTLRLDDQRHAELDAVARVEGTTIAQVVRNALLEHVEQRRRDPEFQDRLRRIMVQEREVLEKLAAT